MLNIFTLGLRIYITFYTRFTFEVKIRTPTMVVEVMKICITTVDWVTPFSLLYLYLNISVGKSKVKEKKTLKD